MLSRTILSALAARRPYITLSLLLASVVTTLPQIFLPELYDTLTGTLFGFRLPHYLFLHVFSHSPSILLPHLLGNLLVLLFFGTISELILGSRRFAVLTLVTLAITMATAYARDLATIHGLSGIIWGYHMPVLFLLLAVGQRGVRLGRFLRDPIVSTALLLIVVDFVGLHFLEVLLLGLDPFENFGQIMHLISAVTGAPFAFFWRGRIDEFALICVESGNPTREFHGSELRAGPVLLLGALLLLNTVGTVDAVITTALSAETVAYTVEPSVGSPAGELGRGASVVFAVEMLRRQPNVNRRSIWYEEPPAPEVAFRWKGERELEVRLSRALTAKEAILLRFDAYRKSPRGVPLPVPVELRYGTPPE